MAMEGLYALICAGVLAAPPAPATPTVTEERDNPVTSALAVQTAIAQAREFLLHQDFHSAVTVLEGQLPRINGNRYYLGLLQDAYRGHIKELRLNKQEGLAQNYLNKLRILDPSAVLDKALNPQPIVAPKPDAAPAKSSPTVRLKGEEEGDDPFHSSNSIDRPNPKARELATRADAEFASKHYHEAHALYEQACQEDRGLVEACRERLAYCKLTHVVEQINQLSAGKSPVGDLEGEVRLALSLAPRLEEHGKSLLAEIQRRRGAQSPTGSKAAAAIAIRHLGRNAEGFLVTETTNFRVLHNQSREFVEGAARVAESTRTEMSRKWFGGAGSDWNPRCDLYLHATSQDYSRVTGVPGNSPGHSSIRMESGQVVGRRIDLHCDDPNLLVAVLPHEATHVVLAGHFGDVPVPRWADEGMAVLTEPRDKVERHLRNLSRCKQDGQTLGLRQLMQLRDYPDPRSITAFYAQSVSLVDFLSNEKGPQVFAEFLREGLRTGYEPALQRYYNYRTFEDLEQRWAQQAFQNGLPAGVADRGR